MKTLQNNFTTPEQSKRLLELGVPADSADCYISFHRLNSNSPYEFGILHNITFTKRWYDHPRFLPCWSVGRLIEIYELCYAQEFIRNVGVCLMEDVLSAIYDAVNDTTEQWDFSKLED